MKTKTDAPTGGYIINNENIGYRATALALMKREGLKEVKNKNGLIYSIKDIENSIIGYIKTD